MECWVVPAIVVTIVVAIGVAIVNRRGRDIGGTPGVRGEAEGLFMDDPVRGVLDESEIKQN